MRVASGSSQARSAWPRRLTLAALVVGGLFVSGAAVSWAGGSILIAPVRHSVPAPEDLPVENVSFTSAHGARLQGWFVGEPDAERAALLMHGVRGDRRQMVARARFLREAGYAVLLFDFQAHGASEGEAITFGAREAQDARAALDELRAQVPDARIAAIGCSLGDEPLDVDVLVLEAVYPTLDEALTNRLRMRLGSAGPALAPLLRWQLPLRFGFGVDDLQPIEGARSVQVPTLVLCGTQDRRTTVPQTRRLFEALGGPKELFLLAGARHQDLASFMPEAYRERVLEFLERALR